MEYFMQFHWWYVLVVIILLIVFTGKGGMVVKAYEANLVILDARFEGCVAEASYSIFKKGQPDKIEIEVDKLTLPKGEELELLLNGVSFARMKVEADHEAEFEHWRDEKIAFPEIQAGDELVIRYQGTPVLKGTFGLQS